MKIWLISFVLMALSTSVNNSLFTENYIGMNKSEIIANIQQNHKRFKLNTTNTNDTYNYLKFEDRLNEITVLFFLTDSNNCKFIRIMSDYSNINTMLTELNDNYQSSTKNQWKYTRSGKTHNVNLEEGDWFFTITIKEN